MARLGLAIAALMFAAIPMARTQPLAGVDWSSAQLVHFLMVDNQFVPDRLTFQHGVPYQLHMENQGKNLHEFTAPEFFADAVLRDPGELANGGKELVLQPGTGLDLYLMPLQPGSFRLICADHDWDGMVGEIVVE